MVDVLAEQVQRGHALDEPALDRLPLVGGDDARDEVEREDPLDAGVVAVDGEGDALVAKNALATRIRSSKRAGVIVDRRS